MVDQTVRFLRTLRDSSSNISADDKEYLDNLSSAFYDVLSALRKFLALASISPTLVANNVCPKVKSDGVGKPAFDISEGLLEDFLSLGFSYTRISEILGVSRWTVSRRIKDYGLEDFKSFSKLSDDELDKVVRGYIREHGATSGQLHRTGYLRSLRLRVQRRGARECLPRLDPQNRALRWGIVVSRRVYRVPWPNSLWHLDGHHSLIRWKLVIHGCVDGFSRRIIYLRCSSNNLAETVMNLFFNAVSRDGDRWPSRIRVDWGVENVLVCDKWINGMIHSNNPLAYEDIDEEPADVQLYGYDPEGPSPLEENHNVVVESIPLDNMDILESYVFDVVYSLTMSTQLGIDLYTQALNLVMERMVLENN